MLPIGFLFLGGPRTKIKKFSKKNRIKEGYFRGGIENRQKGACTNHVDRILDNFEPLPLCGHFN